MTVRKAFKFVRADGSTSRGFRWPMPTDGEPVQVSLPEPDVGFSLGNPCPQFEGDGLCLAKTVQGAQSGGIAAAEASVLEVEFHQGAVLGEDDGKVRVDSVSVLDVFGFVQDPLRVQGLTIQGNLRYADLKYANLGYADLRDADLRYANLKYANLRNANLRYANLRNANLGGADLGGADLRDAKGLS